MIMEKIEPKYVTFEQAKLLKEKGFHETTFSYFKISEEHIFNKFPDYEQDPDDWNNNSYLDCYSRPEQWQVVEWLRVNHSLFIIPLPTIEGYYCYKIIDVQLDPEKIIERPPYNNVDGVDYKLPEEAYSAAFDYIKNNNLI